MLHQETREETQTVKRVIREWTTCDMCHEKMAPDSEYRILEGEVRLRTGSSYPDGGSWTELRADICEKCFHGKVVPWFASQGVKMEEKAVDW